MVIKKGKPRGGVELDGPFLTVPDDGKLPKAASFSKISAIRVFDKKGRRLKDHVWTFYIQKNEDKRIRYAYYGDIHRVEIDRVERWGVLAVTYDLPPAPMIPENKKGAPVPSGLKIKDTSGGKIVKKIDKHGD